jgi:2-succinyl-6-hydroxy-2,4-cyclohexadiene-1-carboxylate synthase
MLHYETLGKKEAPAFFFLHGFLGSLHDVYPLMEAFSSDFFCVGIDLPSHGRSPGSRCIVKSVADTIKTLSEKPKALLGYSMGGRIALQLQKRLTPEFLFLLSTHPGLVTKKKQKERQEKDTLWAQRLLTLSPSDFLSLWYQQEVFSSLQTKTELRLALEERRRFLDPKPLASCLLQMSLGQTKREKSFPSSAHFFYGEEDLLYEKLYRDLPCKTYKVEKAGHTLLQENVEGCIALLQKILLCS